MCDGLEAEAYIEIKFNVVKEHGTQFIEKGTCDPKTELSGLKEDLAHKFGIPHEQQHWYHNDIELANGRTLWEYGFKTHGKSEITVKST